MHDLLWVARYRLNSLQQQVRIHFQFIMHGFNKINIGLLFAIHDEREFGVAHTGQLRSKT